MNARDYVHLLRAGKWVVAASVAGCLALALLVTAVLPTRYASEVSFYVTATGGPADSTASDDLQGAQLAADRVKSYIELLTGRRVAAGAAEALDDGTTTSDVVDAVSATSVADTVIVTLTARGPSPQRAQDVANAVATSFTELVGQLESGAAGVPDVGAEAEPVPVVRADVLEPATLPESAASPSLVLDVLIGLVVGLLLGLGAAVVRHSLDQRLRSAQQLADLAGAPALGSTPADGRALSPPRGAGAVDPGLEALRAIRLAVQVANPAGDRLVLVVVSPRPGEGRTSFACDLAASLAAVGSRVALVDGDVVHPGVADRLDLLEARGLADVLSGRTTLPNVVRRWGPDRVTVVASGSPGHRTRELLASERMAEVIAELRAQHDVVLVDSPPVLTVADATGLATMADGVVLLARWGTTTTGDVADALALLRSSAVTVFGTVLTGAPARPSPVTTSRAVTLTGRLRAVVGRVTQRAARGRTHASSAARSTSSRRRARSRAATGGSTGRVDDVASSSTDSRTAGTARPDPGRGVREPPGVHQPRIRSTARAGAVGLSARSPRAGAVRAARSGRGPRVAGRPAGPRASQEVAGHRAAAAGPTPAPDGSPGHAPAADQPGPPAGTRRRPGDVSDPGAGSAGPVPAPAAGTGVSGAAAARAATGAGPAAGGAGRTRRRRRVTTAVALLCLGAVVALVPVLSDRAPARAPLSGAGQTAAVTPAVEELPTRGSLAGDAGYLAAVRDADVPDPGAFPAPADRTVAFLGDLAGRRFALVVGRDGDRLVGHWYAGPAGAAAAALVADPEGVGAGADGLFVRLPGAAGEPAVVVARTGDELEVSATATLEADGTVSRDYRPVAVVDGVASVTVEPTQLGAARYRLVRDGAPLASRPLSPMVPARTQVPSTPTTDSSGSVTYPVGTVPVLRLAAARPGAARVDPEVVRSAADAVAAPTGTDPSRLSPQLLWSGQVQLGPRGTIDVAVVAVTSPNGAVAVGVAAGQGLPEGGGAVVVCGREAHPAGTVIADLTVAAGCALGLVDGGEEQVYVVTAPERATRLDLQVASDASAPGAPPLDRGQVTFASEAEIGTVSVSGDGYARDQLPVVDRQRAPDAFDEAGEGGR